MLPVQCVDNQAGLNGVVIYENDIFPISNPISPLPVQCVDDPIPLNAVEVYGNEEFPMRNQPLIPVQRVDDPMGLHAVVATEGFYSGGSDGEEFNLNNQSQ